MRLQGGASLTTPTVLHLNSTGAANTTSQLRFVNSGHHITCTDSNLYNNILSFVGTTGHRIYYQSGAHSFQGNCQFNNNVACMGTTSLTTTNISLNNTLEFGAGYTKESVAGRVGYQTYSGTDLDIVGAGTVPGFRNVRIYDNLNVGSSLKINNSSFAIKGIYCGSMTIPGSGGAGAIQQTITHNYSIPSGTQIFSFSQEDLASPVATDCHAFKVIDRGTNAFTIVVVRADGASWSRQFTLMFTIMLI